MPERKLVEENCWRLLAEQNLLERKMVIICERTAQSGNLPGVKFLQLNTEKVAGEDCLDGIR